SHATSPKLRPVLFRRARPRHRRRPLDPADRPGAARRSAALHRPACRPARGQHGRPGLAAEGHGARRPRDPPPAAAARCRLRLRTHRPRKRLAARSAGHRHLGGGRAGGAGVHRRGAGALVRAAPGAGPRGGDGHGRSPAGRRGVPPEGGSRRRSRLRRRPGRPGARRGPVAGHRHLHGRRPGRTPPRRGGPRRTGRGRRRRPARQTPAGGVTDGAGVPDGPRGSPRVPEGPRGPRRVVPPPEGRPRSCPPCELPRGVHREVTIPERRFRSVLLQPATHRSRPGRGVLMRFVRQFLTIVVVYALSGAAVNAVRDNEWLTLVLGLASAALIVLVYAWVVRRTEHRPATDVARKGAASRTAWGILIGGGMFTAVIVNLYTSGHYDIDGVGSVTGAVGLLGFMAAAAATEEVVYRGVLFRIVEEHIGTYAAMGLTGVVFGLSHLFNENATLWGALAIAIEAGFMLAAVYAATRSLWLAIGVHFGWNFAAAGVFSTEVSGNGASEGLLDATTSGP